MSTFLQACERKPVPYTPVWFMRQAGRYQPEYRRLREKVGFLELCKNSDLAAEVTVRAVEQLGVDAAIVFADILLLLEPMGIQVVFDDSEGPRIPTPVRSALQIDAMAGDPDPSAELSFVLEAIRKTRSALPRTPLIGFAGSPFTLAAYLIEGGGSKTYTETKRFMYSDEGAWNVLMAKLARGVTRYLKAQIAAGAQAIQLFDSWIGCLGPADYARYVAPHARSIFRELSGTVPCIHFATGNPALYPLIKQAGGEVLGLDWRCDLGAIWDSIGEDTAVMGNLDPALLLAPREVMLNRAGEILEAARGRPGHIFNLGHGILPSSNVDQVRALVDFVHEASARRV